MTALLVIPPGLVGDVREGAFAQLAAPAEALLADALVHTLPDAETRGQLQRSLALLDVLYANPLPSIPPSPLLLASVDVALGYLSTWLDEADAADPRKAKRADDLRLLREFRAQVRRAVPA
jgi:hypothetical protein